MKKHIFACFYNSGFRGFKSGVPDGIEYDVLGNPMK